MMTALKHVEKLTSPTESNSQTLVEKRKRSVIRPISSAISWALPVSEP